MNPASTAGAAPLPPGVRTYRLRQGRLSDQARERVGELLQVHGVPPGPLDLTALFGPRPVVLEIGFGMGEATLQMARTDRDTGLLAVDVHTPGVLRVLEAVDAEGLAHVRVAREDALTLLQERVPPDALAGIRVYFPDPWPKARHRKRRLVQPHIVALMASRLRPGGVLHLATDVASYATEMLHVVSAEPLLHNESAGYAPRPSWRPLTRYETRGLDRSRPAFDLVLRRRAEPAQPPQGPQPLESHTR